MAQTAVARTATFSHKDLLLGKPIFDSRPVGSRSPQSPALRHLLILRFEHGSINYRFSAGSRYPVTSATSSHFFVPPHPYPSGFHLVHAVRRTVPPSDDRFTSPRSFPTDLVTTDSRLSRYRRAWRIDS